MKWLLVVIAANGTPMPTDLVYDTLPACYAAEDEMAAQYSREYNNWLAWAKANPKESGWPKISDFVTQRLMRGVCIPHG